MTSRSFIYLQPLYGNREGLFKGPPATSMTSKARPTISEGAWDFSANAAMRYADNTYSIFISL